MEALPVTSSGKMSADGDEKMPSSENKQVEQGHTDETTEGTTNDFVIRDGFPALRKPGGKDPWLEGTEPIPTHEFWGLEQALTFTSDEVLEALQQDCATVFSARTRDDNQAYSAGETYFIPCQMQPRCALEALALSIFSQHTSGLEKGIFIPEQSGAEWWTLVLDEKEASNSTTINKAASQNGDDSDDDDDEDGDEIGLHFDADYGLEEQAANLLLHPRLATVTYLSDVGAPTVVLQKRSPPPQDVDKKTLSGAIEKAWVSHPKVGKHIAFDGRLLHGAPAYFFPGRTLVKPASEEEPPSKKSKQTGRNTTSQRITLLVNIWLNHCPLDAEILDDDIVEQLRTPWKDDPDEGLFFAWNNNLSLSRAVELTAVELSPCESQNHAHDEEFVVGNRRVTLSFTGSLEDLHEASKQGELLSIEFSAGSLQLMVGEVVE